MPTYEYICEKCEHAFELFQTMSAKTLTVCPKEQCPKKTWGKGKVKRQMGAGAGLIFKGSGFYITDYRSQNYKDGAKKDNSSTSTPSASTPSASTPATSTPKVDSKPTTPAPAKESKPKTDSKKS